MGFFKKKDKVKVVELGSRSRLLKQHGRELALAKGRIKKKVGVGELGGEGLEPEEGESTPQTWHQTS